MPLVKTKNQLKSHLAALDPKGRLGLVPTMGALHEGHATLVEKAVTENDSVVVSIFVNPTQFNDKEDLERYPRDLNADMAVLMDISDRIIVFAPSAEEMYQNDITANTYDFDGLDKVMEGAFRKGHFNGVGTVVETLLRLVAPDRAYFGEKDFQQLQIIKKIVADKSLPVEIIGCPIVRESNGLAMSSRNKRLSKTIRQEASFIYKTLIAAREKFGMKSAKQITDWVTNEFKNHADLELEYFVIADADTLSMETKKQRNKKYRAFIAVYADDVRLIDNIALNY
ncbi:pantoate--beta-alanine ligase [Flavobacteriaceae bacterium TP-CH-4]|uniref:Pantothenate synthetase n=1 Tax=Pelagihabitans pacificus TaxID=2696054 RepID=A0A967ARF0_9FLAO|nr:pantoate--beta-alanine ligase [Pelagihabitans pacificus]NHF58779.1 pantoate--beta-alanine ligase [Pelagihabitans pacificus]